MDFKHLKQPRRSLGRLALPLALGFAMWLVGGTLKLHDDGYSKSWLGAAVDAVFFTAIIALTTVLVVAICVLLRHAIDKQ
jgi:hypothetical protein